MQSDGIVIVIRAVFPAVADGERKNSLSSGNSEAAEDSLLGSGKTGNYLLYNTDPVLIICPEGSESFVFVIIFCCYKATVFKRAAGRLDGLSVAFVCDGRSVRPRDRFARGKRRREKISVAIRRIAENIVRSVKG